MGNIRVILLVSLDLADKEIKCFRIVFGHIRFDTGRIKSRHLRKRRINLLTDLIGIRGHLLEHGFNVVSKPQFEACKKRHIGDLGKPQKCLSFLQRCSKRIIRVSVGMKKIFAE